MTQGWGDRAGPLRPHSRTVVPTTGGDSGVSSPVIIFDRQAWREEIVSALVEGDAIDLHFALELSDEDERDAALAQIRNRIASVQAQIDQADARLEELR